jgi:lipoprotein signal peptidase
MDGCVLAIDGLAVRVRQPFKSEVKNTKAWCFRKGGFALIVMAGCDVNGVFHMATAKNSGTCFSFIHCGANNFHCIYLILIINITIFRIYQRLYCMANKRSLSCH